MLTTPPREYWLIYRGPGFLAVVWFDSLSPPFPPPFPVSKLSPFLSLPDVRGGGAKSYHYEKAWSSIIIQYSLNRPVFNCNLYLTVNGGAFYTLYISQMHFFENHTLSGYIMWIPGSRYHANVYLRWGPHAGYHLLPTKSCFLTSPWRDWPPPPPPSSRTHARGAFLKPVLWCPLKLSQNFWHWLTS